LESLVHHNTSQKAGRCFADEPAIPERLFMELKPESVGNSWYLSPPHLHGVDSTNENAFEIPSIPARSSESG
jgi:hypothetical protein